MSAWAPLALTAVTAALVALPVTPALYELWKRGDAIPLPTSRHDGKITNFSESFHSRLEPLLPQLQQCHSGREVSRTRLPGMDVLLVGSENFDFNPRLTDGADAVMFSRDTVIPAGRVVNFDVYAEGALELGEGATLRAAKIARDMNLRKNSKVLRWLHADGSVEMGQGSTAYGRFSAGQSILLERGCGFERMHAPQILTVDTEQDSGGFIPSRTHVCQAEASGISNQFNSDQFGGDSAPRPRIRVQGNFSLPPGETLNANVIATGELHLGRGSRLLGSAKSYKDAVVEDDACVHGSIVSRETVHLGPRSFVAGPIMAEGDVLIARGSRVGAPDALTTISSCGIQIAPGCQLHGTVWARVRGSVEG
jgi:hypothetical protein